MVKDLKTLVVLFKTKQNMDKNIKKSIETTDLTVNEFIALEALYSKKKLNTNELRKYVIIPHSSLTYVLDSLQNRGYINREKDLIDRRIQTLSLTELGEEVFLNVYEIHYNFMRTKFDILTKDEEKVLQTLLKKLGKHLAETTELSEK